MKALLVDPSKSEQHEIEFDSRDWRAVQSLVGGVFDYFVLRDVAGNPRALVYCADDVRSREQPRAFAFPRSSVLERNRLFYNWPIVGVGVLVAFDGSKTSDFDARLADLVGSINFYTDPASARSSAGFRSVEAGAATYISDKLYESQNEAVVQKASRSQDPLGAIMKMFGGASGDPLGDMWAQANGFNPDQTFVKHFGREPRPFMPRKVGTFNNERCSVAELEAAFLNCYEWARKTTGSSGSTLARAFDATPFFFPEGLDPTEEEFEARKAVEAGDLDLPFPMDSFWIVRWDMWVRGGGAGAGEGPAMLYVKADQRSGFSTQDIYFDRHRDGYRLGQLKHHDQFENAPSALIFALLRLNNRRVLIERVASTPDVNRINVGRARSKHGLPPLPGFIRVTGHVHACLAASLSKGAEKCRHDRRSHWRKRRNGVELPPEEWVHVRQSTIHPNKPFAPQKPYVVV